MRTLWIPALALILILATGISLLIGRYPLPVAALPSLLSGGTEAGVLHTLLWDVRAPRILAAILVGAALSSAGAAFQAVFMNPLVSPNLLGVIGGAAFGAAAGMILSDHWFVVQSLAFLFGLAAVGVALAIARIYPAQSLLMLVLGGIISGALFTSLLSIVKVLADPYTQLPSIVYWLMGSLSNVSLHTVVALSLPIGLGILTLAALAKYMNALSMGDAEARTLGVPVGRVRLIIITAASLISALTVVIGGMIGWVGLIIPHVARLLVGPDNRILIPTSALLGGVFLLTADDIARTALPVEIPLGIVTEVLGIVAFILVLRRISRGWAR